MSQGFKSLAGEMRSPSSQSRQSGLLLRHTDRWEVQGDDGLVKTNKIFNTVMNTSPGIQQYLAQQPQANQLQYNQTAIANPERSVSTTKAVTTPSLGQLDTVALVQYGGIAVAIILSFVVFMLALAEYNKVFVPVMLQKRDEKN